MFTINMREIDQITQIYEHQAEECVYAVRQFYSEVIELARRTTYAPMVNFGNQIYRFYCGELKTHLLREFRKWYDGSYSFHALMQAINAGSDAVQTARRKMDKMESSLNSLFNLSQSEIHLDNSSPEIKNEDFEDYRQALEVCRRSFDSATKNAESSIRSMGEDNDVVNLIGDIVKTTGISLIKSFEEMIKQVIEGERFTNTKAVRVASSITGVGSTVETHIPWGKDILFL